VVSADAPPPLAFDHARVLADYVHFKATGKRPDPMHELERWRSSST